MRPHSSHLKRTVMKRHVKTFLVVSSLLVLFTDCRKNDLPHKLKLKQEPAEIVYSWYKLIEVIQRPSNPQPSPIAANRSFAYIGVGLYESVQPGINGATSLSYRLYQMPKMPTPEWKKDYLWSASANAALASLFKQLLGGLSPANLNSIDSMEEVNNELFAQFIPDATLARSQAFGRAVANAIVAWSVSDNFVLPSVGYTPPVFAGAWVPTPPLFAAPVGAFLKDSRPFLTYSLTAIAPPPPIPYSEDPNSAFFKEAKLVYDIGTTLTAEQKAIADWFADSGGPGIGLPAPYHLLSIVTGVLEKHKLNLGEAAEMYARVGIAQKDAAIIVFRSKYTYNLLRPVTYIQQEIDETWLSYLPNPPYPEYTSGLAGFYTPILQVLIRRFGDIPFTDDANGWRGAPSRHYSSLTDLMEEAATSRVYAGIHYAFTQEVSVEHGKELGDKIARVNFHGGGSKR